MAHRKNRRTRKLKSPLQSNRSKRANFLKANPRRYGIETDINKTVMGIIETDGRYQRAVTIRSTIYSLLTFDFPN